MLNSYIGQSTKGAAPQIEGAFDFINWNPANLTVTGSFEKDGCSQGISGGLNTGGCWGGGWGTNNRKFKASNSSNLYDNALTWFSGERIIPASVGMYYIIKY